MVGEAVSAGRRWKRKPRNRPADGLFHEDPFRPTVDAYVQNLIVGTAMLAHRGKHRALSHCDLLVELIQSPAKVVPSEEEAKRRLKALARKWGTLKCVPPILPQPIDRNLGVLSRLFGLNATDRKVLQFVLSHDQCAPFREVTSLFKLLTIDSIAKVISIAAVLPESKVRDSLQPLGRLAGSGVVEIADGPCELDEKIFIPSRMVELLICPQLDRRKLMTKFLPEARKPSLAWPDFDHVKLETATARDLLRAALKVRRPGINILLYGPTGTGKTELARLLAHDLDVSLYVTGRADNDGDSAEFDDRLASLRLGNRLVGGTDALLLFDELEDLFEWDIPIFGQNKNGAALMSKTWFNDFLESNLAPTIWITNEVEGIDPAFLRRFTYAIELPALSARQRARVLSHHLGEPNPLSPVDVDAIAQRFEASPAQLGSAVASARLLNAEGVDRATVEKMLSPIVKLVTGTDSTRQMQFDSSRYRVDVLNSPDDLVGIADRLSAWRPGDGPGVSLCLHGLPGTGKSEYVKYLAHRMGRRIVYRRVSDLQSKWVGECEKNIARAFREAEQDDAVLLFDEADSFLRDRRSAQQSWEVSQVNEFLQQLEMFRGVVACTTNLKSELDLASIRRFVFKIELKSLRPEQAAKLFQSTFNESLGDALDDLTTENAIRRLPPLTPGDFAAVFRRLRALRCTSNIAEILKLLVEETVARGVSTRQIAGFAVGVATKYT